MVSGLHIFVFIAFFVLQEAVPHKPSDEFEIKIDYKFEERPVEDRNKIQFDASTNEKNKNTKTGPLPYLKLNLTLLKLGSEEVKIKAVNSNDKTVFNRKATVGEVINMDIGFIDDVKDREAPHEFIVLLYSKSKQPISRIHLLIMEDGTFMVNDQKRGKF